VKLSVIELRTLQNDAVRNQKEFDSLRAQYNAICVQLDTLRRNLKAEAQELFESWVKEHGEES